MGANSLMWVGLLCCLAGLGVQLFPQAAFNLGVDVSASWRVFGFGIFLILVAAMLANPGNTNGRGMR